MNVYVGNYFRELEGLEPIKKGGLYYVPNGLQAMPIMSASRSKLVREIKYCGLVPLGLAYYKKFNNIKYSEWDWNDEALKQLVCNDVLYKIGCLIFNNAIKISSAPPETLRQFSTAPITDWTRYQKRYLEDGFTDIYIKVEEGYDWQGCLGYIRHIYLQTWNAAPEVRTESMILNFNDLDTLPEPYTTLTTKLTLTKVRDI